jgi:hypothetical protein
MVTVKLYKDLRGSQIEQLAAFLQSRKDLILPYQTIRFSNVIDEVFRYPNLSLIAFDAGGGVCGFLPQWKKGRVIESVPWRDKGGPVFTSADSLNALRSETINLARQTGASGILWRDFDDPEMVKQTYFVNVDVHLDKHNPASYLKALNFKVRGKVNQAKKKNLKFKVTENPDQKSIRTFYEMFSQNRHRLGVPVYSISLFVSYFKHLSNDEIKLCEVLSDSDEVLSSLILIHNGKVAIDGYSGSSAEGLNLRANDYMIFNVMKYCMENRIGKLDFGADSPLQESLISYKTKWLGDSRSITSSVWGTVKEMDHNKEIYNAARAFFRALPPRLYRIASALVIR